MTYRGEEKEARPTGPLLLRQEEEEEDLARAREGEIMAHRERRERKRRW